MATKRLQGFLRDPLSEFAQHDLWRFTHLTTTGEVVKGSQSIRRIGADGSYDFLLRFGRILIESKDRLSQRWVIHGEYTINAQTTATTIPALLLATTPVTPDVIQQLEVLLTETETAKNEAVAANQNIENIIHDATLAALVNISGGKWELLNDNFGNKQVVRRVPVHTFDTLNIANCPFTGPLDCFIRQDGSIRPYVDVPVYQMSNAGGAGGRAVSQAAKDPWTSINADVARARCVELGADALMISQEIWAMLCWNMISQDFQPRGNTEFGRSHSNINEFGRREDGRVPNDRVGAARVLTGSGPSYWRHDGTDFGVADLVGNVWEWVDGMKMSGGQFIVADYTGQPEAEWPETGVYISNTGQFTNTPPATLNSGDQVWGNMPKAQGYAGNEKLQRLIIEPIECTKHLVGRFYWNLAGECFPLRGGSWSLASDAGPAALNCRNPRSNEGVNVGFRAAFVP